MLIKTTPNLTRADSDRLADQTHAGQAHFAGTGPDDAQCLGCIFFRPGRPGKAGVFSRPPSGRCAKYTELMGEQGKEFPATAPACRYYGARS